MRQGAAAAKRKTVDIERGLFLVRYASSDDPRHPPTVRISFEERSGPDTALIIHPDARDAILSEPGTALAVRAASPAKLLVEVMPTGMDGSTAATVKVEALNPGAMPETTIAADGHLDAGPLAGGAIRLRAHVAGIGDVIAAINEWVAGPSAPSRIEGLAIDWPDMPAGLDLRYAVRSRNADATRLAPIGSFVGTRGRALPVTGIVLELSGAEADGHELVVLGAPVTRLTGRRVVANGPTSREPLVGLRIDVARRDDVAEPASARSTRTRPGQVRVFRGRSRAQAAAV